MKKIGKVILAGMTGIGILIPVSLSGCTAKTAGSGSNPDPVVQRLDAVMPEEARSICKDQDNSENCQASYYLYGFEETDSTLTAYTWVLKEEFDGEGNVASAASLPVKFEFDKNSEDYTRQVPEDGELYPASLKSLFPAAYVEEIDNQDQSALVEKLHQENAEKAGLSDADA